MYGICSDMFLSTFLDICTILAGQKQKLLSHSNELLGQEMKSSCGATRLDACAPTFAYDHMLAFDHGAPISVSHTRRLPFRSPSEVHSSQLRLPHSHHRRLSGWKHVCDYSLFLNGLFDCPYLSTSGGNVKRFFAQTQKFLSGPI